MRRQARADHRHGIPVFGRQPPFDVEHHRRIINLPQQFRIFIVGLRKNIAAELLKPPQLSAQVHRFFPVCNRLSRFLADAADLDQLMFGSAQNGGRVAEVLE